MAQFANPTRGPLSDRSGVTTAGTSVQVAAQNLRRNLFFFQNLSNVVMFVNFGAVATNGSPSIQVSPADTLLYDVFCPTDGVNVWCASDVQPFTAKEG